MLQAKVKDVSLLGQRDSVLISECRRRGSQRGKSLVDAQTSLLNSWRQSHHPDSETGRMFTLCGTVRGFQALLIMAHLGEVTHLGAKLANPALEFSILHSFLPACYMYYRESVFLKKLSL